MFGTEKFSVRSINSSWFLLWCNFSFRRFCIAKFSWPFQTRFSGDAQGTFKNPLMESFFYFSYFQFSFIKKLIWTLGYISSSTHSSHIILVPPCLFTRFISKIDCLTILYSLEYLFLILMISNITAVNKIQWNSVKRECKQIDLLQNICSCHSHRTLVKDLNGISAHKWDIWRG